MPRLSVLMPAYNSESTVEKAVRSTLRALPSDAELRVMDDGSTDGTLRVLEPIAFAEKRLVVTAAPQNGGVARTLNSLLGASDSELVARMDADDVVLPWRFAVSSAVIERTRTDAVFMSVVHNDAGRLRPMAPLPLGPRGVRAALLVGNPVAHSTMMARRSALDAVSGYREVPSEDYDLWMRLSADGYALRRTGTPGIVLRRHESQVTARPDFFAASAGDAATAHSHAELSRQALRGALGSSTCCTGPPRRPRRQPRSRSSCGMSGRTPRASRRWTGRSSGGTSASPNRCATASRSWPEG